jgi:hypothetical protein
VLTKDIHQTNASEELQISLAEWRSIDIPLNSNPDKFLKPLSKCLSSEAFIIGKSEPIEEKDKEGSSW